ncbi:hypothetical protein [Gemmatimonas phototrophica]|nr:hypothetical protein [Gemmatimonas phototrophica]
MDSISLCATDARRRLRAAAATLVVAGGAFGVPATMQAQGGLTPPLTSIDSMRADGSFVTKQLSAAPNAFNLFAGEDLACGTYRGTGDMTGGTQNEGGPVSNQAAGSQDCVASQRGFYFAMPIVGGSGPSNWRKIRAVYPNARTMLGSPGYSGFFTFAFGPQKKSLGPADGQFGKTFSGVTSANDGSCRGNPNTFRFLGNSLLATKDCPETWGSEGFKGKAVIPDATWLDRFKANPTGFSWDEWKIPATAYDPSNILGTQQLYGFMSDYYREQKLRFGSVVAGGAGAPSEQGYPMGIEFKFEAFQFGNPAVRNTIWYQLTMVNKSADVYGVGVDYDSLYYGLGPGMASNQNANAMYFQPQDGSVYIVRSGASGNCNATSYPKRYAGQTLGCNSTAAGFGGGAMVISFLKSPLGDLRNKLFTQPSSPYYAPNHPNAGDTITYNHAAWGAFGNNNLQFSMRGAFGMVSGIESDYLDGRTPAQLGAADYLNKFRPEEWSGVVPDADQARFNKFVPGSTINPATGRLFGKWDYNKDGIQDTISVPGCGSQGCHVLWSDTIPGGYRNGGWGNIMNTLTAGPFSLRASDTTQFLFAFTWAPDSLQTRTRVDAMLNAYLTNYAGPTPVALPTITPGVTYTVASAEFVDSSRAGVADASVGSQITIRYPQISPVDQFMLRSIAKIRQDSIDDVGNVRRVLRLNPGLLARMTARANDNLAAVYIFKSCNQGNTWTTSSGNVGACVDAPTRNIDAGVQAFNWRPWATTTYANGIPAAATVSEFVMGGRTYVYSLVTRTRGFSDFAIVDSSATGFFSTDVQNALSVTKDTISSALAGSGPSTITVYAPITNAAGRSFARVDTSTVLGKATQDVIVGNVNNDASGRTRMVFANQFIVRKTIDTITSAASTTISARYIVPSATTSPTGTRVVNFLAREQQFTVGQNIPVRVGTALLAGTARGVTGSSRLFVDTVSAPANSMGYVWVTQDGRPIYMTSDQYAANFDRDQLSSPLYPGYTVRSRDSSNAATGMRQELLPSGTVRDRDYLVRAPGDTIQPNAKQFAITVRPITAVTGNTLPKRVQGGAYTLTWQTDPWGPKAPFRLDPPQALQATIDTSLNAMAALATNSTITDAKYNAMIGATTARPLVRVRLPFTMKYTDPEDGRVEDVKFAMLARATPQARTRLMGSGNDTIRVNVPDSLWLPGDTLYVIQRVPTDSAVTIGGARTLVLTTDAEGGANAFRPIRVLADSIGLSKFLVACTPNATSSGTRTNTFDQQTCNPLVINTRGATPTGGYLPVAANWSQFFELTKTFDPRSVKALVATPFSSANEITKETLSKISVVPNPYIVRSDVDDVTPANRTSVGNIVFTGLPDEGTLRIYSVSGQYLQELKWTASDLLRSGNNSTSGDLAYNLRTREGIDLGSGLYLFVVTATGERGKNQVHRGKFVIIR